ncbi:hypothetical protein IV203_030888 [Nitzschia inconspicua]|uniref:Uncharacterized protein n=1 Tax=Nitzschia inconspicua TaxID=303405 RepID=A0A9K3LUI3_9STRA|nr:hypothetical protein IV203_030888 [Nitzschia inconspicua]
MVDSTTFCQPSEAELYIQSIAVTVGMGKDSDILQTICQNMKQEYLIATWQLALLDSHQWRQLGAPMGLAVAAKYYSTNTTPTTTPTITPRRQQRPTEVVASTPPRMSMPPPTLVPLSPLAAVRLESTLLSSDKEVAEVANFVTPPLQQDTANTSDSVANIQKKATEVPSNSDASEQQIVTVQSPSAINDSTKPAPTETETMEVQRATVVTGPSEQENDRRMSDEKSDTEPSKVELETDASNTMHSDSPNGSSTTKAWKDCQNLADTSYDTLELTDEEDDGTHDDDDDDDSNNSLSIIKVDIDGVVASNSCRSPRSPVDEDNGIPLIARTGSSDDDEEDDPEEVAELVGSLDTKESHLWLEREQKQNDDDATVVVSNVSPERKSEVKKALEKNRTRDNTSAIPLTSTFESEAVALQEILEKLPDKDHRNILSQLMITTNARGQVSRIKLALQVKDALLASMEENQIEADTDDAVRLIFHLARLKKQYRVMFGRSLFKAMSKLYKHEEKQKDHDSRRRKLGSSCRSSMPSLIKTPETSPLPTLSEHDSFKTHETSPGAASNEHFSIQTPETSPIAALNENDSIRTPETSPIAALNELESIKSPETSPIAALNELDSIKTPETSPLAASNEFDDDSTSYETTIITRGADRYIELPSF